MIWSNQWVLEHITVDGDVRVPENDNEPCLVGIDIDEKDVVGVNKNYIALGPGESYEIEHAFYPVNYDFEEEMERGERYRYRYVGGNITWWDWGMKEVCCDVWSLG